MKQQRRSYLITRSLKKYLLASIITMAVANLNTMIDGILMGNILGPRALSAINLCLPVINAILALDTLLAAGAVMVAARALGQMDRKRLYEVFTLSSLSVWAAGILLLCTSAPLSRALSRLLSGEETLVPLCEKYIRVLLSGSIVIMYANSLSMFLDVCGHPKTVTAGMSLSVIVNILLDCVLVKLIGMDIGGAGWATVAGSTASTLFLSLFTIRKKELLRLSFRLKGLFRRLGEIVAKGVAQMIGMIAVTVLQIICNTFIQNAQGENGMFVLSVGYSLLGISSMVASGMCTAFTAIGGVLMGQKDHQGLRILFRQGMTVCLLTGVFFMLISILLPAPLASLFGADTEELLELAAASIPLIGTFMLAVAILLPFSTHYQVLGRFTLSSVTNLSIIAAVLVSCLTVSGLMPKERIWLAFPLSCVLGLLTLGIAAFVSRAFSGENVSFPDLIPRTEDPLERFDLSVACTQNGFEEGMERLWAYLEQSIPKKTAGRVGHCVEELLLNIVLYSGGDGSRYVDILILKDGDGVTALLRDNGTPFDTSSCAAGSKKNGLRMAHHFCPRIEYSYTFGQNMTLMKWPPEE